MQSSSKSQLGSSDMKFNVPNSPQINLPLSISEFQNSIQQKQKKEQINSVQNTAMGNIHYNSCSLPLQMQSIFTQEYKEELCQLQQDNSLPKSQVLEQQNSLNCKILDNDETSTKSQNLEQSLREQVFQNSLLQGSRQMKRLASTQNSNDGGYHGNILQIGVSFSPLSSTHNSQNSTIQVNNLLASSGNSNKTIKTINSNPQIQNSPNTNPLNLNSLNNGTDMPLLMKSPSNLHQSKEKQSSTQKNLIKEQNDSNKYLKLKRNSSYGSFSNIQNSSLSIAQKRNAFELGKNNRSRNLQMTDLSVQNEGSTFLNNSLCNKQIKNSSQSSTSINNTNQQNSTQPQTSTQQNNQDFNQLLLEISCQNSLHLYNNNYLNTQINNLNQNQTPSNQNAKYYMSNNNNNNNNYIVSSNLNLPKQQSATQFETNQNKQYLENNQSSYFNQLSTNSGDKNKNQFIDQINSNNSCFKPSNLSFTEQSKQIQDFQYKQDSCNQNINQTSLNSSNNKTFNQNFNQSAATFQDSASDQKLNNNQLPNSQITPFIFNKPLYLENKQFLQNSANQIIQDNQNQNTENRKIQMCKNHRHQSANHYALDEDRNQQFYCYTCAVLLYSQGHQIFSIEESLELNAMKMIVENKRMKEIQNKKEAVDKILFAVKDLIPQITNSICSMDRKEGDIYKFLETQERNLDSQFNKLIFELNQNRKQKLDQLLQCKQQIKKQYLQVNQVCQNNLQQLIKVQEDILDNYNNIILQFEENKVASIIQNYFSIWNQANLHHESISNNDQLFVYKSDQNQFKQINDQINFLCSNTLKQIMTTFIKKNNDNNQMNLSILSCSPNKLYQPNYQFTRSKSSQILPISTDDSYNSMRNQQIASSSTRQNSQKQIYKNESQNNDKSQNLTQKINKNHTNGYKLQAQKQQVNQNQCTNYQRKIKSLQHSMALNNKQVYISFDNKDAFKNHLDAENKENVNTVNGVQTKFDNSLLKVQSAHHSKAQSQPQLIYIDLKDIQKMPSISTPQNNNYNSNIQIDQNLFLNTQQQNDVILTLDDCTTFRKKDTIQEIENETQIGDYLQNLINKANLEKQKLNNNISEQNQNKLINTQINKQEQNCYQPKLAQNYNNNQLYQNLDIYGSLERQNQDKFYIDGELEQKAQGQTPNFSNKNKLNNQSPSNRNLENVQNQENNNNVLKEFSYLNDGCKELDDIIEKEQRSRDSSINKKKHFNEMIKAVQHNQIQRNLNCENILRKVSDNQLDLSSISCSSTPQHFRSNSGQTSNLSCKNSLVSSKNRYFLRSDEHITSEKYNQAIKKSPIEEMLSSNKFAKIEDVAKIVQKLSFEKGQQIQDQLNMESIVEEDSRISQTIVKSGVDNNYENILLLKELQENIQREKYNNKNLMSDENFIHRLNNINLVEENDNIIISQQ
ncbi:hypothetical protein TTHERM_00420910 (macronuclear) [Tetrahymena thermophila SB210]|uniref:Uncharacterized protein n=1 Tax=Tetrahymena thermophila (strain SB210) TaxID=312017 RepID=I7M6R4_TETTS|nr:hypothetical protein TTHERM_00420910 [Tetrahymena thermophila SB210]EAR85683.2 hypothetical protein TTHERM_00420910 [Tetrahymena thermophila SB210]|eukprot:XP_001033346.2 hypothetical protein TTHERM_00420910 [Tetrahymena thermophila SB210]